MKVTQKRVLWKDFQHRYTQRREGKGRRRKEKVEGKGQPADEDDIVDDRLFYLAPVMLTTTIPRPEVISCIVLFSLDEERALQYTDDKNYK